MCGRQPYCRNCRTKEVWIMAVAAFAQLLVVIYPLSTQHRPWGGMRRSQCYHNLFGVNLSCQDELLVVNSQTLVLLSFSWTYRPLASARSLVICISDSVVLDAILEQDLTTSLCAYSDAKQFAYPRYLLIKPSVTNSFSKVKAFHNRSDVLLRALSKRVEWKKRWLHLFSRKRREFVTSRWSQGLHWLCCKWQSKVTWFCFVSVHITWELTSTDRRAPLLPLS